MQVEPGNRQAQELEAIIQKKMEKEGLIGMAVVGGATLALGGNIYKDGGTDLRLGRPALIKKTKKNFWGLIYFSKF